MSVQNLMQVSFTAEEIEKINLAKDTVQNVIKPKLIQLSPEERKSLPKAGHKMSPFSSRAYNYGSKNPQYVPGFLNMDELRANLEVVSTLTEYLDIIDSIREMLQDTILIAGSKAYKGGLSIYETVKTAAKNNQPGAQIIADDLGKWFQRGSSEQSAGPAKA
jgi:hypothetical protein